MKYKGVLMVCIVGLGFLTVSSAARTEFVPAPQQDVIRLDQRLSQLEQRLFMIENNLRRVEQLTQSGGSSRGAAPEEMARLRSEVQALTNRLAEHECALAKLDERTLSPAMRAARKKSIGSDLCRQSVDGPIQLR